MEIKIFFNASTRQFSRTSDATFSEDGKPSFWKRHRGKILAAATLAAIGGLGYANKDNVIETAERVRYKFMSEDEFWRTVRSLASDWDEQSIQRKFDDIKKCVKYIKYNSNGDSFSMERTKALVKKGIDMGISACERLKSKPNIEQGERNTYLNIISKLENLKKELG